MDHLELFRDLVSDIKANGVPEDHLLCKLFKYSLSVDALCWLKRLPQETLTSWNDIENTFMRNFFDDVQSEDLRNMIAIFIHKLTESFKSLWIRFMSYQRDCPYHGFYVVQLLITFFRAIALVYHMALDIASEKNLNTRNPEKSGETY